MTADRDPSFAPAPAARFSELAADALRYWERRRLWYNAVLLAIVVLEFIRAWPGSWAALDFDRFLSFFILAVVANVLYCSSYIVDLFVQLSPFRSAWTRRRWVLFAIGVAAASIIAHFIAGGTLAGPRHHL